MLIALQGVVDFISGFACLRNSTAFSLVFFDHAKDAYLPDLLFLESKGFIAQGSVVVADNILYPGSPDFRAYVKQSPHYQWVEHESLLEYQTEKKDIVMVATHTG